MAKWTQKGTAEVKDSPARMKQARAAAEKLGGKVMGMWVTMGEYDSVIVLDMPNEQAASLIALGVAQQGAAATQTMRAFSEEEFAQLVTRLV